MFIRLSAPAVSANRRAAPLRLGSTSIPGARSRPLLRLPEAGLVAGTLVETDTGWQPVESLAIGQLVQTWDGGLQPLMRLERQRVAPNARLLQVPGGVLSTCTDLVVLPGQHLLVETGAAAELLDCDTALVPAAALEGWRGVAPHRPRLGFDVVTLAFEAEEIVFANTGALLHCAAADARTSAHTTGRAETSAPQSGFFTVLDRDRARALLGFGAPDPEGTPAPAPQLRPAGLVLAA